MDAPPGDCNARAAEDGHQEGVNSMYAIVFVAGGIFVAVAGEKYFLDRKSAGRRIQEIFEEYPEFQLRVIPATELGQRAKPSICSFHDPDHGSIAEWNAARTCLTCVNCGDELYSTDSLYRNLLSKWDG